MAQKPVVRRLKLKKRRGSVFPGEIAGYSDPLAQQLIDANHALEVDEDDKPIHQPVVEPVVETPSNSEYRFKEATDPFMNDGLSKAASHALHNIGIHTVEQLKAWVADEANDPSTIEGLTEAQAEKIGKLYFQGE